MDKKSFDLGHYLNNGVENIVKGIVKASFLNPKASLFMLKYASRSGEARKIREHSDREGTHIPPFLIASITKDCNLQCAGCYSRANQSCSANGPDTQLTSAEWERIFREAHDLGISFILLAGGEPLMRSDVLHAAGRIPGILFPVFTNGTMLRDSYLSCFDTYRNLIPIVSLEGQKSGTDKRRGRGVYDIISGTMDDLQRGGILFGVSVTVTTENLAEVTDPSFTDMLYRKGCKAVIFVEYVPVEHQTAELAPGDADREYLENALSGLRNRYDDMLFIAFPGDEKALGGCLAAGRGFFHINPNGGAEPCPFSPYSDINIRTCSLKDALRSPLFHALQSGSIMNLHHSGGCVLFEHEQEVRSLINAGSVPVPEEPGC